MTPDPNAAPLIGGVLRASTTGFTCGARSQDIHHPSLGAYVQTVHQAGELIVVGVIMAIRVDDDPLVRQLIMAGAGNLSAVRDQRENRLVPVEIDVLNVGYVLKDMVFHNLPPRPPLSLDPVTLCAAEDVAYFTRQLDFLRLIASNGGTSVADLLGAAIQKAAATRHSRAEQTDFLIRAGRHLAAILSHDMLMLQYVLKMIRPN